MRPIDHAEAHERLADLALEPATMALLDTAEGLAPLRSHIAACAACREDLASWQATLGALDEAVGSSPGRRARLADLVPDGPTTMPVSLRAAVARIPAGLGVRSGDLEPADFRGATVRRVSGAALVGWRRAVTLVAALAVLIVGAAVVRDQATRLDAARAETQALQGVTAVLDRVLSQPGHREVTLVGADGTPNGTVAWSNHDLVVMTMALAQPAPGQTYRCWVERGGVRSPVGEMWFAGGLAYWTGSLDGWATISLDGGGQFGVSLEASAGGSSGAPVLVADLPG